MGLWPSKEQQLYEHVTNGSIEEIKALHYQGALLEWRDQKGKTPLIVACTDSQLYNVAKLLIELGADVNTYRRGRYAGTPLHHAAKSGLDEIVKLLLSHGANPLVMNADHQSPLDVARKNGYSNVVRTIESHICFFSGWLREFHGSRFLDLFASQHLSRNVWAVVIPCIPRRHRNHKRPLKLKLSLYTSLKDSQPCIIVSLWKAKVEEPKFNQPDPVLTIFDYATGTKYKLASVNEGDKQQLQLFSNACRGIPQASNTSTPVGLGAASAPSEDVELAMAIKDSIQATQSSSQLSDKIEQKMSRVSDKFERKMSGVSDILERNMSRVSNRTEQNVSKIVCAANAILQNISVVTTTHEITETASAYHANSSKKVRCGVPEGGTSSSSPKSSSPGVSVNDEIRGTASVPSAPLIPEDVDCGPFHYPAIDSFPVDLTMENKEAKSSQVEKVVETSSSCVICLDAPVEGACIPCGHMAGCMSCLNGIKAKEWGCPVCRANIDQVIKLYAV